jgi:hypothetical protein
LSNLCSQPIAYLSSTFCSLRAVREHGPRWPADAVEDPR